MRMELIHVFNLIFLILFFSPVKLQGWRITFPKVDDEYPRECSLENGTSSVCRSDCVSFGKLCYFKHDVPFYCCKDTNYPPKTNERPAVLNCISEPQLELNSQRTIDTRANLCTSDCDDSTVRILVVKGLSTFANEFPFMVALGWKAMIGSGKYDFKCGGVLITPKFALTAAHCTYVNGLPPCVVLPGGVDLDNYSTKPIKIARIIDHPEYESDKVYHDIALIELQTEASVSSIPCIWTQHEFEEINLTAIGYGHTSFGGASSNQLLKAYFNVVPKSECQTYYERNEEMPHGITDKQLCAKDPESIRDTCQGDSGGPLIMVSNINNFPKEYVVGITSYGQGCALSPPGIYTRVSSYVDWIESIVWSG